MTDNNSANVTLTSLQRAYNASLELERRSGGERDQGVKAMAKAVESAFDEILEANTADLEISREMAVPDLLLEWLKLTPQRLADTVGILQRLGQLSDPLERVMNAPYQLNPSQTYCQLMPLGVIALIYEAFPELGAIAAGLSLKTGNSLILRGCSVSSQSGATIARILQTALEDAGLPGGCLEFLSPEAGGTLPDLVQQHRYLNLVIPYGRPSLVEQVSQAATAPVLRSAMGNCYLYWSLNGDLELVRWLLLDSHASEPDPVNAIEKVLFSPAHNPSLVARLFNSLKEKDFQLRGEPSLCQEFPEYLTPASEGEWGKPYLDKIIAFKSVPNLAAAIEWMNRYSSSHADCLVTESYQESRQFAMEIDSAMVYINTSPRFYRNPKQGDSVFLGISNQKGHRRGLISLESFTTLKQVVQGNGKLSLLNYEL
jgi:glutamate-5-semialdehyde dehydrogenase